MTGDQVLDYRYLVSERGILWMLLIIRVVHSDLQVKGQSVGRQSVGQSNYVKLSMGKVWDSQTMSNYPLNPLPDYAIYKSNKKRN